MSASPPRTIRRKSLGTRPIQVNTEESDEISGFSVALRAKLLKEFSITQRLFEAKIKGSNDPDYPRSELVQHLKHNANTMYVTSKLVCETICDVPESSPIILFGFLIGLQSLLHAAWSSVHPGSENPLIGELIEQYLQKARIHQVTDVEFRIDDLDEYVEKLVELFDFRNEGAKKTSTLPSIIKTPNKKTMKVMFGGPRASSPVRKLQRGVVVTTDRSVSPGRPRHSIVTDRSVSPPRKRDLSPSRSLSVQVAASDRSASVVADDASFASVDSGQDEPTASPSAKAVLDQLMIAFGHALNDLETPESVGVAIDMATILKRKLIECLHK